MSDREILEDLADLTSLKPPDGMVYELKAMPPLSDEDAADEFDAGWREVPNDRHRHKAVADALGLRLVERPEELHHEARAIDRTIALRQFEEGVQLAAETIRKERDPAFRDANLILTDDGWITLAKLDELGGYPALSRLCAKADAAADDFDIDLVPDVEDD